MRISSFISFAGFVMVMAATFCPILHFIFNQDIYQLNRPFGLVFLLIAVIGIIGAVLNNTSLVRVMAWTTVGLTIFFFIAALVKIHFSFNFIPLRSVSGYLSGKVKFKWGWYFLCFGALLAVAGTFSAKSKLFKENI